MVQESFQVSKLGQQYSCLFPFSADSLSFIDWCPLSWKPFFCVWGFFFFGSWNQEGKSCHCGYILARYLQMTFIVERLISVDISVSERNIHQWTKTSPSCNYGDQNKGNILGCSQWMSPISNKSVPEPASHLGKRNLCWGTLLKVLWVIMLTLLFPVCRFYIPYFSEPSVCIFGKVLSLFLLYNLSN